MNFTLSEEKTFYQEHIADYTILTIGLYLEYNLPLTTMNTERNLGKKEFGIRAWDRSVYERTPHGLLFYRDRQAGFDRLDKLGLPQAEREVIPLLEFTSNVLKKSTYS